MKTEIIRLELEAFPDHAYSDKELHKDFTNPENIIILLRNNTTQQIAGYMYAVSIDKWEPERFAEKEETILIDNVVIDKMYRGHHLLGKMATLLEDKMRERNYKYFEINANISNGYAATIAKVYKARIIAGPKRTPLKYDAMYGARMWFRIKL